MTEPFAVRVDRRGTETRIVLSGEVDLLAGETVAEALAEALEEPMAACLVVDLHDVSFIDSSGLTAAVILPARAAQDAGITFSVRSGVGVTRALEISGLDRFVHPNDDDC